tara:strand:- start:1137 stop:1502 length:366 start_codon:yes stop_codon:yes gene_type:complete
MDLLTIAHPPLRYKLWKPLHVQLIVCDLVKRKRPVHSHATHLAATIARLCRAQDIRQGKPNQSGISAGWSFEDGWLPSYPETSGYIVETFLAAQNTLAQPELRERASRILNNIALPPRVNR